MTSTDTLARAKPRGAFRPDIEGMRALAILLVLVYHAGVSFVPGGFVGVDVFFVLSGFLITGLLLREVEQTGRIRLGQFYARRARRLLPATGVVLLVTAVVTWLTVSVVEWRAFGLDIVASALYVVNWRLSARSVDYLAEDVTPSPVQHFWSLAVEEQFYIIWPLLLVLIAWWLRRGRTSPGRGRRLLTAGLLVVIIPSFAYSVFLTSSDPASAFFVTPTRLWELGIGALVAMGGTLWDRLPRGFAAALGWSGLAAVVGSALLVTSSTPWPGHTALAPTLGTAAMIVSGYSAGGGVARVLSVRPAIWIGGLSYSLYLWHWPLIVGAIALFGDLSVYQGLLVIAASFVPAYLCWRFIENPIRFSRTLADSPRRTASVGVGFTALGAIAGVVLALAVHSGTVGERNEEAVGAGALADTAEDGATAGNGPQPGSVESLDGVDWFVPAPADAEQDVPGGYEEGCQVDQSNSEPTACTWGPSDASLTIALVGDSKALQWQSALEEIAGRQGWRIVSYTKSACAFQAGAQIQGGEVYTSCVEWNAAVLEELTRLRPDIVVTSNGARSATASPEGVGDASVDGMAQGLATQWQILEAAGIPVVVLLDNAHPGIRVHECVAAHPDSLGECTFDRDQGSEVSGASAQSRAAERSAPHGVVDLMPWVCPEERCVPVIGNVLIYRQGSHLTDTYVRTLTDRLEAELLPHVEGAAG